MVMEVAEPMMKEIKCKSLSKKNKSKTKEKKKKLPKLSPIAMAEFFLFRNEKRKYVNVKKSMWLKVVRNYG